MIYWIAGLAAGLLAGGAWTIGAVSQRPRRQPIEQQPDVDWEDITFRSGGSTLKGWFMPAPPRSGESERQQVHHAAASRSGSDPIASPLIILVHGWSSNRSRMLRYAKPLHAAGYALLLYDARSHGESDGIAAPSGLMFAEDVLAALEYAASRPDVDPGRIGVLGHSMGGYGSVLALGRTLPDDHRAKLSPATAGNSPRIRALVTDAMPVHIHTMAKAELRRKKLPTFPLAWIIPAVWFRRSGITRRMLRQMRIEDLLNARRRTAVLCVHSVQDDYIPSSELSYVLDRLKSPVEHLLVSSPGHRSSETDPAFWPAVLAFLRRHL